MVVNDLHGESMAQRCVSISHRIARGLRLVLVKVQVPIALVSWARRDSRHGGLLVVAETTENMNYYIYR
jgi:hypothetical protein